MELLYEKALREYNLKISELPEDAQTGIISIKDVQKGINMLERKGGRIKSSTLNKVKAMDKWVYYEILDFVHDTEKNEDDIPFDSDEIIDEIEENNVNSENTVENELLLIIESELSELNNSGQHEFSIEELKSKSPKCYSIIFEEYEKNSKNGIKTSRFSLIETKPLIFNLQKI